MEQTQQVRDLAAENTRSGLETVKQYTGDYANLAGEYIGKSRQKIPQLANDAAESTKQTVNDAAASIQSTASDVNARVQSQASNLNTQVQSRASDLNSQVQSTAGDLNSQVQSKASNYNAQAQSAAGQVSDQMRDTTNHSYQTYQTYPERDMSHSANVYVRQEDFPNASAAGLLSSASHTQPIVHAPGSSEPAASAAAI